MKCISPTVNVYQDGQPQSRGKRRNPDGSQTFPRRPLAIRLVAAWFLLFSLSGEHAQSQPHPSFRSLYSFTNGTDGAGPFANLMLSGNTLYGTALKGGTNGSGTVFAVNMDGTGFRTLYCFSALPFLPYDAGTNIDGAIPYGALVVAGNTLYGVAAYGGTNGDGTMFAVNTDATGFRLLHTFNDSEGRNPVLALTLGGNRLYGTAIHGGTNDNGTVFAVNIDGTAFTNLYMFNLEGVAPECSLVLSSNTLYGTALDGGSNGSGTVFAVNIDGTIFRTLYAFSAISGRPPIYSNSDGAQPSCTLVLSGNTLYGTTEDGGTNSWGTVFAVNTDGTDFKLLHTFSPSILQYQPSETWSNLDGASPVAGLVLSGNTLYGTAPVGGTNTYGTVFAVNTDGTHFTVVHTFNGIDGADPESALMLSGNTLYGTTAGGGADGDGTIFAITLPSIPAIASQSMAVSSGQLQFVVSGLTSGATVYVQASSDLSATSPWLTVATNVATGANLTVSGLSVTNANSRFFRVVEAPPP